MLTNAILITLAAVLNTVINILPRSESLPSGVDSSLDFMASTWASWASIFPFVNTMLTALVLALTIYGFVFLYGGVNWTINKVRGSG